MKKLLIFVGSLAVLAAIFFFRGDLFRLSSRLPEIGKSAENLIVNEIRKEISTPPPLRAKEESPRSFLTRPGVIARTNSERTNYFLPELSENATLDIVAEERLRDMFAKQYFAHVSPSGEEAGTLADALHYEYLAIGENIALGNFENDEALIRAWMESPGHRANILSGRYAEIGVAVGKGTFDGRETWLGVQVFGLPLSACPEPDASLKVRIETLKNQISELEAAAAIIKDELAAMRPRTEEEAILYNQKVDAYNALVNRIRLAIAEAQNLIRQYNGQVGSLNECVASHAR